MSGAHNCPGNTKRDVGLVALCIRASSAVLLFDAPEKESTTSFVSGSKNLDGGRQVQLDGKSVCVLLVQWDTQKPRSMETKKKKKKRHAQPMVEKAGLTSGTKQS